MFSALSAHAQFHTIDMMGNKDEIAIPFEYEQGFIIIKVFLGGVLPLNFIFDTGAENTILFEREYAILLGLSLDAEVKIIGSDRKSVSVGHISRQVDLSMVNGRGFTMDLIVLENAKIDFKNIIGRNIDGIIGGNMLYGAVCEIDYRRQFIKFHKSEKWRIPRKFQVEDITIVRQRPFLKSTVAIDDRNSKTEINLLIDTGAAIHFMIDELSHPDLLMPDSIVDGRIGEGLGGNLGGFIGNVNSISLLGQEYKNTAIYFQKADTTIYFMNQIDSYRNGIIGNLYLARNRLIIDYTHSKLYFKPYRNKEKAFRFNKSGMTVFAVGPYLDEYIVKHVMPRSAADVAGVRTGDVIIRMNHNPHFLLNLNKVNRFLSKSEGEQVRMKVRRNGSTHKFKFTLKNKKVAVSELED